MNTKGSKHLDLSNRSFIEQGLNNNSSKTSIAEVIGMDKSSVCKEIKKHCDDSKLSRQGVSNVGTYDCQKISSCGYNTFCKEECPNRIQIYCKVRGKIKGVSNGCDKKGSCKLTKRLYSPTRANEE